MNPTSTRQPPAQPAYVVLEVLAVAHPTPSLVRVDLGGAELKQFPDSGAPDESVRLYFPADGEIAPPRMTVIDGRLDHHDPSDVRVCRTYTVRRRGRDRLVIDFVVRHDGVAARWASQARPGQYLGVWGVKSWYALPPKTPWQILIADLTGIPAMSRAIEQLSSGARVHAIAEVADPADIVELSTRGDVTVEWHVSGNGEGPSQLDEALRAQTFPEGTGYVWFAGEATAGRQIRKELRNRRGLPISSLAIMGYWRLDKDQWLRRYRPVSDGLIREYEALMAAGVSEPEAEVRWDEILESAGL